MSKQRRVSRDIVGIVLAVAVLLTIQPAFVHAQTFSCSAVTEIPPEECNALVSLYGSTGGPDWWDHSGWLENISPCAWYGVACVNGHVHALYLAGNRLGGSLPPALGQLSYLSGLHLENNELSGSIPPELGGLTNLAELTLHGNQFEGNVPAELGSLPGLKRFSIAANTPTAVVPLSPAIVIPSAAPSAGLVSIVFNHSNKCIRTIDGDMRNLPIQIEQATCQPGYRFLLEQAPGAGGYYFIKVFLERGVVGCLGVPDIVRQDFGNGAVKVKDCRLTDEFKWQIVPLAGPGSYWNLLKPKGDAGYCLGVENYPIYTGNPTARFEDKRLITVNWCNNDPWQMVALRR